MEKFIVYSGIVTFRIRENYITDTEYGTIYGGHPKDT